MLIAKLFREITSRAEKFARGQFTMDIGNVIALIVLIAIGAFVVYAITGAFAPEAGSYAENAINNVEEKASTVFNLLTIMIIVIVAAVIIGVVLRALGRGAPRPPAPAY